MGEVVSFFSRSREKASQVAELSFDLVDRNADSKDSAESPKSFEQIAEKNAALQERLRRERAQANVNVLKSYRIK